MICRILLLAAAFLIAPSGCQQAGSRTVGSVVEERVGGMMRVHQVPGVAVAVVSRGEVEYFCFGTTSPLGSDPVTPDTLFELGSVSKTFTGLLGAWIAGEGGFRFDDPLSRSMPELAGSAFDRITMDQLATYASGGLPLQVPSDVGDDEALIAHLRHWVPTREPGAAREYSNPSIGLFGRAAARRGGRDFKAIMTDQILPALGMHDTYFGVPAAAMPRYAWGCDDQGLPVRVRPGVLEAEAYGLKSTAADMGRYLEALIDPQSVATDSAASVKLARAIEETRRGRFSVGPMTQGLGWEMYPYPARLDELLEGNSMKVVRQPNPTRPVRQLDGDVLCNKTGATDGFCAYVVVVPRRGLGVVLLANRFVPGDERIPVVHAILQAAAAR